jgi:two-component system nitrate/nitrite response regulator NarL
MSKPVFITSTGQASARWELAFPTLTVVASVKAYLARVHHPGELCWLDIAGCDHQSAEQQVKQLSGVGCLVVVLSPMPSDEQAYAMLTAGARGYCHLEAVPQQLQDVAAAVSAGGVWMPAGLVQRLVSLALQVDPPSHQPSVNRFSTLTEREYQVALEVGRGANNKEIAANLGVGERTVKAHLTAIFEKLGLRDRVQLALAVNRMPMH